MRVPIAIFLLSGALRRNLCPIVTTSIFTFNSPRNFDSIRFITSIRSWSILLSLVNPQTNRIRNTADRDKRVSPLSRLKQNIIHYFIISYMKKSSIYDIFVYALSYIIFINNHFIFVFCTHKVIILQSNLFIYSFHMLTKLRGK